LFDLLTASRSNPAGSSIKKWWVPRHRDILSSLVVAFAMMAEAFAFSGIAGAGRGCDPGGPAVQPQGGQGDRRQQPSIS
jgi:hypothetical protein